MIGSPNDYISGACQVTAILIACTAGAYYKSATVAVEHHRSFAPVGGWSPNVQKEAILVRRRLVAPLAAWLHCRRA